MLNAITFLGGVRPRQVALRSFRMGQACTVDGETVNELLDGMAPLACPTGPDCFDIIDSTSGLLIRRNIAGPVLPGPICAQWGYTYGYEAPAPTPATQAQPAPVPVTNVEPAAPMSIDIQAFTPGYTPGVPATQPTPLPVAPAPMQPPPVPAPTPAQVSPQPPVQEDSSLTEVALAGGLVAAVAAAVAIFG